MQQLIGEWHGTGTAIFPTIDTTTYREVLQFEPHADDTILKIEQKTWRIHPDQAESLLYWECGFLRQLTDTTYEWINAQNNGRTEVLKGEMTYEEGQLSLNFVSKVFSNDVRMVASQRILDVKDDVLSYTTHMATQTHPSLQQHLIAELRRVR